MKRGTRWNRDKSVVNKEKSKGWHKFGPTYFFLSMSHNILQQREFVRMSGAFKKETIAPIIFLYIDGW